MTLKHINWHQSEVLRELERQAVKRGHFDPEPEEIVKLAHKKTDSMEPGDDLYSDIMRLAHGLRAKGFEKQANELEKKAVVYKVAETHLYRVHDEDGEDLLDFAYPDGDVEVAPSKSNLGKVWTPQSQQKAILDVVKKQPKVAELANEIKRVAQEPITEAEKIRFENQKKINNVFDGLKKYIRHYVRPGFNKFGNFDNELNNIANKLNVDLGFDVTEYENAIKKINNSVNELKQLQGKIAEPAAGDLSKYTGYVGLQSAIRGYENAARSAKESISKLMPVRGQQLTEQDRPIDVSKVKQAIEFYTYAAQRWDAFLNRMQQEGDEAAVKGAADNLKKSSAFVRFLSVAIDHNYSLRRMIEGLAPQFQIQNEDELIQQAREYALKTEREIERVANSFETLTKVSQDITPVQRSKGPKATVQRPKELGKPEVGLRKQPVSGRPTQEEKQTVILMQQLMSDLAKGIIAERDAISMLAKLPAQNLTSLANVMADTGGAQTFDGKWGSKTNNGLQAINKFMEALNVKDQLDTGHDFRSTQPEIIIDSAKKNTNKIINLANQLKLTQHMRKVETAEKPGKPEVIILDQDTGITLNDVQSLPAFYNYLETVSPNKSAKRNDDVVKFAQEIVDPWEKKPAIGTISVAQFDNALRSFYNNARAQLVRATRPTDGVVNTKEIEQKRTYENMMRNLALQWFRGGWRDYFLQGGNPNTTYIDPLMFHYPAGAVPSAATRPGAGISKQRPEYGQEISIPDVRPLAVEALKEPPFTVGRSPKRFLDIVYLANRWIGGGEGDKYRRFLKVPDISQAAWGGGVDAIIEVYAPDDVKAAMNWNRMGEKMNMGKILSSPNLPAAAKNRMRSTRTYLSPRVWVHIIASMIASDFGRIYSGWRQNADIRTTNEEANSKIRAIIEYNEQEMRRWIRQMSIAKRNV